MTHIRGGFGLTPDAPVVERASHAVQQAELAQGRLRAAQLSAADSLDRSADSHERLVRVYEQVSELDDPVDREERQERAARHRMYAEDDHWIAQQLREMASR